MTPYRLLVEALFWKHAGAYVHEYLFVCPRCGRVDPCWRTEYGNIGWGYPGPHVSLTCGITTQCDFSWVTPEVRPLVTVDLLSEPQGVSGLESVRDQQLCLLPVGEHYQLVRTSRPRWQVALSTEVPGTSQWVSHTPYIPEWAKGQILLDLLEGRNWI